MNKPEVKKNRRTLAGTVVSDKMDKTIVVRVDMKKNHPIYEKQYRASKKYKVHDPKNTYKVGDTVNFVETRHISKDKYFRVIDVTKSA
ncbi:MAG: 30S ribosomal protein S17 [Candidatus Kerfeldbacteria bacterium RIFCSPHIGHO2_12_FULL_48_17]|uniref:Small ribosomal subunit protein uS17 n=1 Tax=Candidatus Kerfeldbacteria bacterium RIFCSPHIGHO2_12_FULL_48_17 TaxID=1798542 RepID=A0A1G2B6B6_9BACT|nr:MAG: 30S ribosomal protein S17 [Candidatus Kerfeldbacteria bacterium RIFCSPHIGHO2_12_FULL_48_17]